MYHKCIAYRRHQRERLIRRREGIIICAYDMPVSSYTRARGKLAKGKVHCSCPLCAAKTKRNMGIRDRSVHSYKIADQRRILHLASQLKDISFMEDL